MPSMPDEVRVLHRVARNGKTLVSHLSVGIINARFANF